MSIRFYKPSDAEGIAELLESVKHRTCFADQQADPDTIRHMLGQLSPLPNAVTFVQKDKEGKVTGVLAAIEYHRVWNTAYRVAEDLLFVAQGKGKELLAAYKDWAVARGAGQVIAHCASADPRTDKWYESMGAKKLGSIWEI